MCDVMLSLASRRKFRLRTPACTLAHRRTSASLHAMPCKISAEPTVAPSTLRDQRLPSLIIQRLPAAHTLLLVKWFMPTCTQCWLHALAAPQCLHMIAQALQGYLLANSYR